MEFIETSSDRIKHDYTSELELKSLLIREKNSRLYNFSTVKNNRINELIKNYSKLDDTKYDTPELRNKRQNTKNKLKDYIIKLSEKTNADTKTHERFGEVVLLMIKNILRKPNFSGYTWRDEFYSDASYKVFKYLHNFDHTKTSQRTGLPVNAFSYISQIIHNSIIYVIGQNNNETRETEKISDQEARDLGLETSNSGKNKNKISIKPNLTDRYRITKQDLKNSSIYDLLKNFKTFDENNTIFEYPADYVITLDEYYKLREILRPGFSIIKSRN